MSADLLSLYRSLAQPIRPEEIAAACEDLLAARLGPAERAALATVSRHSVARAYPDGGWDLARLTQDYGLQRQYAAAEQLFGLPAPSPLAATDPVAARDYLAALNASIAREPGTRRRLNRTERAAQGLEQAGRRYRKQFRLAAHIERKIAALEASDLRPPAPPGLIAQAQWEDFAADLASACYVAFEASWQRHGPLPLTRAANYERVGQTLWQLATSGPRPAWALLATIAPAAAAASLEPAARVRLLGDWTALLVERAAALGALWRRAAPELELLTSPDGAALMAWNQQARLWNHDRDAWIGLVQALGQDELLEALCPGRCIVLHHASWRPPRWAFWLRHTRAGRERRAWGLLPGPWQVMRLRGVACERGHVRTACEAAGLGPEAWLPAPSTATTPIERAAAIAAHPLLEQAARRLEQPYTAT